MPRGPSWIVGLTSVLALGCLHAPVPWSPDGRWIAYTMAVPSGGQGPAPWWIFESGVASGPSLASKSARPAASGYRLWATRAETGESVLLEESKGPLTSPCWSPDGKALAFGRLVVEAEGRARFEVVVQDGPGRRRVLLARPVSTLDARAADLPALAPAWSGDGRYLAVPYFQQSLGLAILRADNGRLLKVIEDAYWPSWAPDRPILAFVHAGEPESLQCLDANFGPPRHLADLGQTCQAPAWSRDGRSIVVLAGATGAPGGPGHSAAPARQAPAPNPRQPTLIRVQVETGKVQPIVPVTPDPVDRDRAFYGGSFTADRDGEILFFAADVEGEPTQIAWVWPRTGEIHKRFHPIDYTVRVGALALNPNQRSLAFRVGSPGQLSPPGLCDPASERFTPIVPDDAARVEWLSVLIRAAGDLLRTSLPAAAEGGRPVVRASLLPIPGEFPANSEVAFRLRRLGGIGRPLCDRPAGEATADPATAQLLDEARLFFDYLREDFAAALKDLDAVEARATTPDARLRLLSVRAQVFLGLGQFDRAERVIQYLKKSSPTGNQRAWEATPAGVSLRDEPSPGASWPGFLAGRAEGWKTGAKAQAREPDDARPPAGFGNVEPMEVVAPPAAVPFDREFPVPPGLELPEMPPEVPGQVAPPPEMPVGPPPVMPRAVRPHGL